MDAIDRKILTILQADADITNADLAERVNLTPSTCLRRVQKLKESGVIRRTVAIIDPEAAGLVLTALLEIHLAHHGLEQRQTFLQQLMREPAVLQAWSVTGESDIVCVLHVRDMKDYHALKERLLYHDPNVTKFRTIFSMETYKNETAVPLD